MPGRPHISRAVDTRSRSVHTKEARMTTQEIGKRYVALCQQGKGDVCLDELYAKNAVSVEAAPPPGRERTAKGVDAIRAKDKAWQESHVIHRAEVTGPFPNDNRFA